MHGYMFRSRLGALIFTAFILLAVYRMVGTEDDAGQLAEAARALRPDSIGEAPRPQATVAGSFADGGTGAGDWGTEAR